MVTSTQVQQVLKHYGNSNVIQKIGATSSAHLDTESHAKRNLRLPMGNQKSFSDILKEKTDEQ